MNITDITDGFPELPIPEGHTIETLQADLDRVTGLVDQMPDTMKQQIRKGLALSFLLHGPENADEAVYAAARSYGRVMRDQSVKHGVGDPERISRNAVSAAMALGTYDVFTALKTALEKRAERAA